MQIDLCAALTAQAELVEQKSALEHEMSEYRTGLRSMQGDLRRLKNDVSQGTNRRECVDAAITVTVTAFEQASSALDAMHQLSEATADLNDAFFEAGSRASRCLRDLTSIASESRYSAKRIKSEVTRFTRILAEMERLAQPQDNERTIQDLVSRITQRKSQLARAQSILDRKQDDSAELLTVISRGRAVLASIVDDDRTIPRWRGRDDTPAFGSLAPRGSSLSDSGDPEGYSSTGTQSICPRPRSRDIRNVGAHDEHPRSERKEREHSSSRSRSVPRRLPHGMAPLGGVCVDTDHWTQDPSLHGRRRTGAAIISMATRLEENGTLESRLRGRPHWCAPAVFCDFGQTAGYFIALAFERYSGSRDADPRHVRQFVLEHMHRGNSGYFNFLESKDHPTRWPGSSKITEWHLTEMEKECKWIGPATTGAPLWESIDGDFLLSVERIRDTSGGKSRAFFAKILADESSDAHDGKYIEVTGGPGLPAAYNEVAAYFQEISPSYKRRCLLPRRAGITMRSCCKLDWSSSKAICITEGDLLVAETMFRRRRDGMFVAKNWRVVCNGLDVVLRPDVVCKLCAERHRREERKFRSGRTE